MRGFGGMSGASLRKGPALDDARESTESPRRAMRPLLGALAVIALFASGTAFGLLVAPGEQTTSSPSAVAPSTKGAGGAAGVVAVPLGLEPTVKRYLDALVSHDWPAAHALMCADLGERITAGGLQRELSGSEKKAGPLEGFTVTSPPTPDARTAVVAYVLRFANGTIDIKADLQEEGAAWRVCAFTNGHGSGAFA